MCGSRKSFSQLLLFSSSLESFSCRLLRYWYLGTNEQLPSQIIRGMINTCGVCEYHVRVRNRIYTILIIYNVSAQNLSYLCKISHTRLCKILTHDFVRRFKFLKNVLEIQASDKVVNDKVQWYLSKICFFLSIQNTSHISKFYIELKTRIPTRF